MCMNIFGLVVFTLQSPKELLNNRPQPGGILVLMDCDEDQGFSLSSECDTVKVETHCKIGVSKSVRVEGEVTGNKLSRS